MGNQTASTEPVSVVRNATTLRSQVATGFFGLRLPVWRIASRDTLGSFHQAGTVYFSNEEDTCGNALVRLYTDTLPTFHGRQNFHAALRQIAHTHDE